MTGGRAKTGGWVRGLMVLCALLLFAAPLTPAVAAMSKGDCCAEAPCHDQVGHDHDRDRKAPCPDACLLACHVLVAPETAIAGPAEIGASPVASMNALSPPGRAPAPELPPPR